MADKTKLKRLRTLIDKAFNSRKCESLPNAIIDPITKVMEEFTEDENTGSLDTVADMIGSSRTTAWRLANDGRIKKAGYNRYDLKSVESYVQEEGVKYGKRD